MARRILIALIWLVATAVAVTIAIVTKVGPVVVVLPGYEHGLHVGDVVAIAISYVGAAILTFVLPPLQRKDGVDPPAARTADGYQ